ncbi:2OG-Fe dioxygenase family protein [uncultured Aquimarina sp.]|uniref:2OG-Fe dioxygenase family protein n=1 Tax=uncultured Aquimarina sp. TaxID=575652 RepID=UPI00260805D0|nr:2OG-Fe dioxygenase family protein [uncultured Aquimarina sp.]
MNNAEKTQVLEKQQPNVDFAKELATNYHALLAGSDITQKSNSTQSDIRNFKDFWNNLELDPYMPDGGKYRYRRIGYLSFDPVTKELKIDNGNMAFVQSKSINKFVGDVERVFAPAEDEFLKLPILSCLIQQVIDNLPLASVKVPQKININVHQMRIKAFYGALGLPTPEGIHQDGHKYVSQHLIARNNIAGGISGLYDLEETPIVHKQLCEFLDTIVVCDEYVKHDVSPIYSFSEKEGYRDMLIIDYNISS